MSRLTYLKQQVHRLGRLRLMQQVLLVALATISAIALIVLVGFALDWSLNLPRLGRVVLLGLMAGLLYYTAREYIAPDWPATESETDLALWVEHQHGIDSDLVSALQFEAHGSPNADESQRPASGPAAIAESARPFSSQSGARLSWGSNQLQKAVVDYVAEFSPTLNVLQGFSWQPTIRRAGWAAAVLVVWLGIGVMYPDATLAYFQRLTLADRRYPTRTQLVEVRVNGTRITSSTDPGEIRVPMGRSVEVVVTARGELPAAGAIELVSLATGSRVSLPLPAVRDGIDSTASTSPSEATNDATNPNTASAAAGPADTVVTSETDAGRTTLTEGPANPGLLTYRCELPRVNDAVTGTVYLGDTWSDSWKMTIVPTPAVSLELNVTPPDYMSLPQDEAPPTAQSGIWEGSRVAPAIRCQNKQLRSVVLWVTSGSAVNRQGEHAVPCQLVGTDWVPADNSLWNPIRETANYRVEIEDVDGLSPEPPVRGQIRVKRDRPPRVAAAAAVRRILPIASPRVRYAATDDFGLLTIRAQLQVTSPQGRSDTSTQDLWQLPATETSTRRYDGEYRLDLSSLRLEKGDELRVTIEAWDVRGTLPPESGSSEPVVFTVTDRQGILSGLMESDQQSAKQLDAIIQRELGIGGSR